MAGYENTKIWKTKAGKKTNNKKKKRERKEEKERMGHRD
jgi:hypothetical protein